MKQKQMLKKTTFSILAGLGLLVSIGGAQNVLASEAPVYQHKDVKELTEAQRAVIQKGRPEAVKEGEQIIYVYQANGKCDLPVNPQAELPNTGTSAQWMLSLGLGVPTLGAAVYLLSKNKKGRQTFMVLVLAGTAVLGSHVVSADSLTSLQEQIEALVKQDASAIASPQDLDCFEYVGYIRGGQEVPSTVTPTTETTTTEETTQAPLLGNVVVQYLEKDTDTVLKAEVVAVNAAAVGTTYNVSSLKEEKITVEGMDYYYEATEGNPEATVADGTTTIRYYYVKGGKHTRSLKITVHSTSDNEFKKGKVFYEGEELVAVSKSTEYPYLYVYEIPVIYEGTGRNGIPIEGISEKEVVQKLKFLLWDGKEYSYQELINTYVADEWMIIETNFPAYESYEGVSNDSATIYIRSHAKSGQL